MLSQNPVIVKGRDAALAVLKPSQADLHHGLEVHTVVRWSLTHTDSHLELHPLQFVEPFAASLVRSKQRVMTQQYVAGLVSRVETKNVESIAYLHD